MPKLGVNIDHIATLRQARRGMEPDPAAAAQICEAAGADSIVAHLREDRRHMQDRDIFALRDIVKTRFNLEMSLNEEIINIACGLNPDQVTIVPERRKEITTEGGLDVAGHFGRVQRALNTLRAHGVNQVSLFIDPEKRQIESTKKLDVPMIELHTGSYANARAPQQSRRELAKIAAMTQFARKLGLTVNAGHGLNYQNTAAVAAIEGIEELNIGHSIISRAVFAGLSAAVREMVVLVRSHATRRRSQAPACSAERNLLGRTGVRLVT